MYRFEGVWVSYREAKAIVRYLNWLGKQTTLEDLELTKVNV